MPRRTNRNRHLRSILHSPVLLRQLLTPLETAVRQTITEEKEEVVPFHWTAWRLA